MEMKNENPIKDTFKWFNTMIPIKLNTETISITT